MKVLHSCRTFLISRYQRQQNLFSMKKISNISLRSRDTKISNYKVINTTFTNGDWWSIFIERKNGSNEFTYSKHVNEFVHFGNEECELFTTISDLTRTECKELINQIKVMK